MTSVCHRTAQVVLPPVSLGASEFTRTTPCHPMIQNSSRRSLGGSRTSSSCSRSRGQGTSAQTSLMWSTSPAFKVRVLGSLHAPLPDPFDAEGPQPITVYLPAARGILN